MSPVAEKRSDVLYDIAIAVLIAAAVFMICWTMQIASW